MSRGVGQPLRERGTSEAAAEWRTPQEQLLASAL
jgi:hypothetical protein